MVQDLRQGLIRVSGLGLGWVFRNCGSIRDVSTLLAHSMAVKPKTL